MSFGQSVRDWLRFREQPYVDPNDLLKPTTFSDGKPRKDHLSKSKIAGEARKRFGVLLIVSVFRFHQ